MRRALLQRLAMLRQQRRAEDLACNLQSSGISTTLHKVRPHELKETDSCYASAIEQRDLPDTRSRPAGAGTEGFCQAMREPEHSRREHA